VRKIFALLLVIALSIFSSCQKQQTDAERQAEIDRQVQQRLDAEHQAQEKEQLAQRESELNAREKALAEKQNAVAESSQRESRPTHTERTTRTDEHRPTASYDTFYTQLDRYGDWRETSDYGYVWQPRQAQSRTWRPYTDGHWVYTDVGWTWVSEEPFGWATYHYGRWTRLRNVGWVWVPGDEWAPAWVSWRKSNDYVGWAPLPPEARFDRGTGIHNWSDSYYDVGPDQYCFVETKQFGAPRLENAVVPSERNVTIVNQTTNVTNITYNNTTIVNQGPSYDEIRTQTQQPIERLRLEREVNININVGEPRPVVRGQAIVIPAPLIARGQAIERPRRVKETITNVVVDRGWENTRDRQATEKVRVKMKAEATPPPNAPPKTFVKPTLAAAETPSTSSPATAATAAPPASATSTSTPASSATIEATATPVRRATPETTTTATATPSATARATATPVETATATPPPTLRPRPSARSTSSPSASPSATASPAPSAAASQTASPTLERSPVERSRSRLKPSSTAAATESASRSPSAPVATPIPRAERSRPTVEPSASPSPSSSASPTPNSLVAPTDLSRRERREMKKEERQASKEERKKEKRRGGEPVANESNSTPTITPKPAEQ
jgi:uncharacterized protein DUF6600